MPRDSPVAESMAATVLFAGVRSVTQMVPSGPRFIGPAASVAAPAEHNSAAATFLFVLIMECFPLLNTRKREESGLRRSLASLVGPNAGTPIEYKGCILGGHGPGFGRNGAARR